jgi:hypothetical protein
MPAKDKFLTSEGIMLANDFIYFLILSPCIRNLQAFNNRKIVNAVQTFMPLWGATKHENGLQAVIK